MQKNKGRGRDVNYPKGKLNTCRGLNFDKYYDINHILISWNHKKIHLRFSKTLGLG